MVLGLYPTAYFLAKKEIDEADADSILRRFRLVLVGGRGGLKTRKRRIAIALALASLVGLATVNISSLIDKKGYEIIRMTYSQKTTKGKDSTIAKVEIVGVPSDFNSAVLESLINSQLDSQLTINSLQDEAAIYISPNPVRYGDNALTLHNLPHNARFQVFAKDGHLVADLVELADDFEWNLESLAGERLTAGVYQWYVRVEDKSISGDLIVVH